MIRRGPVRSFESVLDQTGLIRFAGGSLAGLLAVYSFAFIGAGYRIEESLWGAFAYALAGCLILTLVFGALGALFRERPILLFVHLFSAGLYALAWYATARVLMALPDWTPGRPLVAPALDGAGLRWQLAQGVLIYAVAAQFFFQRDATLVADSPPMTYAKEQRTAEWTRLLSRVGDQIQPFDVGNVVYFAAADDYVEMVTLAGRKLLRVSLGELEERLDPDKFVRVHRSAIINLDRVLSMEPAGSGRLDVALETGDRVIASRAGAERLRRRIL